MRKFLIIMLATLLLVGAGQAHAGGYYDYGYRYHERPHRDAYLVGGLLLGLAAGIALADRDHRYDNRYDVYYYNDRWRDYDRYRDYRRGYGFSPRYGREVVVYREIRRPLYRDRYDPVPPRRYGRYGYRGW